MVKVTIPMIVVMQILLRVEARRLENASLYRALQARPARRQRQLEAYGIPSRIPVVEADIPRDVGKRLQGLCRRNSENHHHERAAQEDGVGQVLRLGGCVEDQLLRRLLHKKPLYLLAEHHRSSEIRGAKVCGKGDVSHPLVDADEMHVILVDGLPVQGCKEETVIEDGDESPEAGNSLGREVGPLHGLRDEEPFVMSGDGIPLTELPVPRWRLEHLPIYHALLLTLLLKHFST
mmetsp:Transcript_25991/g.58759  ORF Transcript_25991/g.58759 Transcript_25991/m.58759 type:complete len:234 (-) Transcript_25991:333-1034(-)